MDSLFARFRELAQSLRASYVPCWGDAALGKRKPKAPISGLRLGDYLWRRLPTSEEQVVWELSDFQAYGLVCGRISDNLTGLDFDDLEIYREAVYRFHYLRETMLVQSLRGMHIYLRLPSSMAFLRKRPMRGGDFIFNGGYIIGPGSVVEGRQYKLIHEAVPYELTESEALELLLWLQVISPDQAERIAAKSAQMDKSLSASSVFAASPSSFGAENQAQNQASDVSSNGVKFAKFLSERAVLAKYAELLQKGRNNALFEVASYVAQCGVEIGDKRVVSLIASHILAPAPEGHLQETYRQRAAEANATVRSAYKLQSHRAPIIYEGMRGLPNSVREALLKYKWGYNSSTIPARVLDALYLAGIEEGQEFSYSHAATICDIAHISSSSLAATLTGRFSIVHNVHIWGDLDTPKKAPNPLLGDSDNRKVRRYRMPSRRFLAKLFGVRVGVSDPLEFSDLISHRLYREKLHRGYLDRISASPGVTKLSERLGLSRRSVFRYNQRMGIVAVAREAEVRLSFQNIDGPINGFTIFAETRRNKVGQTISPGRWLEIEGKRYPAKKGIALRAMKKGLVVHAVIRLTSQYFLPEKAFGEVKVKRLSLVLMQAQVSNLDYALALQSREVSQAALRGAAILGEGQVESGGQDDLSLIKGLGKVRQGALRRVGISSFVNLVRANAERIAKLFGMGKYVTEGQVRFWQAQALKLQAGGEVGNWNYLDWKNYQFELGRLVQWERIRDPKKRGERKQAIIGEFVEMNWAKYADMSQFPEWLRKGILRRLKSVVG
jgi:predicted flap endonuclease-1-like 5' DNA nuclease